MTTMTGPVRLRSSCPRILPLPRLSVSNRVSPRHRDAGPTRRQQGQNPPGLANGGPPPRRAATRISTLPSPLISTRRIKVGIISATAGPGRPTDDSMTLTNRRQDRPICARVSETLPIVCAAREPGDMPALIPEDERNERVMSDRYQAHSGGAIRPIYETSGGWAGSMQVFSFFFILSLLLSFSLACSGYAQ